MPNYLYRVTQNDDIIERGFDVDHAGREWAQRIANKSLAIDNATVYIHRKRGSDKWRRIAELNATKPVRKVKPAYDVKGVTWGDGGAV